MFSKGNLFSKSIKVFLVSFAMFAFVILAAIIPTGGIWVYYGDFNVQQIPFYIHLHDLIRSGNLLYDWCTDLGGSVIGCYSFYILGSPFFWLSVPFPSELVPYLIPWINCLKYAVMATTSFLYIRRHTKTEEGAFWGALLFAFSGYSGAVIVYNHFHDVMAFFPLLLIAFENAMEKKKRVMFVLSVALMAIINYYFFVGEVVFLIIYWFTFYFDKSDFKKTLKLLGRSVLCGACGVLLSCVYLLPAVYYTMGNSRLSEVLSGEDLLVYEEPTMILAIIKNIIMLPDISGLNTMFNQSYSRVSGVAGYIPLFSVSCVIAFFIIYRKNSMKKLITVCAVFAAVPFLNSLFSALNSEYYARWFFMPLLVMAAMSAKILEDMNPEIYPAFRKGVFVTVILNVFFWLCSVIPYNDDGEWKLLGKVKNREILLTEIIFSAVLIAFLFAMSRIILPKLMGSDKYKGFITISVIVACVATTMTMMITGKVLVEQERCDSFIKQVVISDDKMELADSRFHRMETEEDTYNYPMIWNKPSITSFISTIPGSTIDFYEGIGTHRKVTSSLHESRLGARTLLSGKYYLMEGDNEIGIETIGHIDDPETLKGYTFTEQVNGFDVYKNEYFIPMGFSFENCISEEDYLTNDAASGTMDKMLLKALILDDEAMERYGGYMHRIEPADIPVLSNLDMPELSQDLRSRTCNSFKADKHGFVATVDMNYDNLLFFSVPYEKGFTAYVDDVKTDIVKVDFGLSAVFVPWGTHEIRFSYFPSNMKEGAILSAAGILLLLGLCFFEPKRKIA